MSAPLRGGLVSAPLNSAIYKGCMGHHRFVPVEHGFEFGLWMMYLDLDELDQVFSGRWLWSARGPNLAWFRRADYMDPEVPSLADAARRRVAQQTGHEPQGPIRLLTHLRTFGYCFNPVSFYYCYAKDGETLEAVVPDITNTPWGERYQYVLNVPEATRRGRWLDFNFPKSFHVSPFMPMDIDYRWCFQPPGEQLEVAMYLNREGKPIFRADLSMQRHAVTGKQLAWVLMRYPVMSMQVSARIYWQALRLWLKKAPFYSHPGEVDS